MITNERQYRISKSWIRRFEEARANVEGTGAGLAPRARQALREQYDSQIEELAEYEAVRSGRVTVVDLDSLIDIPGTLIRARIAAGLSQEQLAVRLGLKKQQVQGDEATRYAGVGVERLQAVADALGMEIHERVVMPAPRLKGKDEAAPR